MADGVNGLEARGGVFGPAPADFAPGPLDTGRREAAKAGRGGLCTWLEHARFDLTGPERVWTRRAVIEVTGSDGLQSAAPVAITYDPEYEQAVVHTIRVYRGGEIRDLADPAAFEVIQRELNMERAVYDGSRTAHMVIPDVRVGDRIETCFSIVGRNPVLKDHFSGQFILQWGVPVMETRCEVRLPEGRDLAVRQYGVAPDPVESRFEGGRMLTWRAVDLPPYLVQPNSPPSYVGFGSVRVADRMSWADVAGVFAPLYEPAPLPADLGAQVEDIRGRVSDPGERLVEGLRLVQGVLRYHSVSLGEGGFRPRTVEQIWATRYGDCKDGSVLLTAVLRALGIDAVCALVNTAVGEALKEGLPHTAAFNHCIVRARVGGRSYWLDSTWGFQGGDLDHLAQPDFHWALPLVHGADLEAMPAPPEIIDTETSEVWTLPARADMSADVEITTVYRGARADGYRRWLANEGAERIAERLKADLEPVIQSQLEAIEKPVFTDDLQRNEIRLQERYYVLQPFASGQGDAGIDYPHEVFVSRDDVIAPMLPGVGPETRYEPLDLGQPRRFRAVRTTRFPVNMDMGGGWNEVQEGPGGVRLTSAFDWSGPREGVHTLDLAIRERTIPAKQVADYREFRKRAGDRNAVVFRIPVKGKAFIASNKAGRSGGGINWWWVALVFAVLAIGRLVSAMQDTPVY